MRHRQGDPVYVLDTGKAGRPPTDGRRRLNCRG
jgi:hypothetical protein